MSDKNMQQSPDFIFNEKIAQLKYREDYLCETYVTFLKLLGFLIAFFQYLSFIWQIII